MGKEGEGKGGILGWAEELHQGYEGKGTWGWGWLRGVGSQWGGRRGGEGRRRHPWANGNIKKHGGRIGELRVCWGEREMGGEKE